MKNFKSYLFALALSTLIVSIFSNCRKDSFGPDRINGNDPIHNIEVLVYGEVTSETGVPMEGAVVSLGNVQVQTDSNGIFGISGLANKKHGFLRISKTGFFDAFPTFTARKDGSEYLEVILIPKGSTKLVSGTKGGTVVTQRGASVTFQSDGFTLNGSPYRGNVSVNTFYLDPTRDDIDKVMPGNLTAINAEGEDRLLRSFGMLKVELTDGNGNEVELSKPAELSMPIPDKLLSDAPSTIPMWYFDEDKAKWIEEGVGVLEGTNYKASVEHFTFWNCDVPSELISLSGSVEHNGSGIRISVCIINEVNGEIRCSHSNSKGLFEGKVPRNVPLKLSIIYCDGEEVYTESIGPFADDHNLQTIELMNFSQDEFIRIYGLATDCMNKRVSRGFIEVQGYFYISGRRIPGDTLFKIIPIDSDGSFDELVECSILGGLGQVYYRAIDLNNVQETNTHFYPLAPEIFTPLIPPFNFGEVKACFGSEKSYFKIDTIGGPEADLDTVRRPYSYSIVYFSERSDTLIYRFRFYTHRANLTSSGYEVIFRKHINDSEWSYIIDPWNQRITDPQWSITSGKAICLRQNTRISELVTFEINNALVKMRILNIVEEYPGSNVLVQAKIAKKW